MENKKIIKYIIDTSAIIADPDVIYRLKDNIIYIPVVVVRELDGLKNSDTEWVAQNARKFTRTLDNFSSYADLMEGVKLSSGGILKLYRDYIEINELDSDADNKVVGAAMHIRERHSGRVCVLSTDGNMRVIARSHGLAAEFAPFYIGENEPKEITTKQEVNDINIVKNINHNQKTRYRHMSFAKKSLITFTIIVLAVIVAAIFTLDLFTSIFIGTIGGIAASMIFWAVKYHLDIKRMGIKASEVHKSRGNKAEIWMDDNMESVGWSKTDEFCMPGGKSYSD